MNESRVDTEIQLHIATSKEKFDYAFATLCFAALTLSLQFSARMEYSYAPLLVVSWALYLGAALMAGWRLMVVPEIGRVSDERAQLQQFVVRRRQELIDPTFLGQIAAGRARDPQTLEVLALEDLDTELGREEAMLAATTRRLEKEQSKAIVVFNLSLIAFLLALVCNGTYLAINLLSRSGVAVQGLRESSGSQ